MQLSKLVPVEKFNKKNSAKLEKAEILEVTVHYLTQQQFKEETEPSTNNSNTTSQGQQRAQDYNTRKEKNYDCFLTVTTAG